MVRQRKPNSDPHCRPDHSVLMRRDGEWWELRLQRYPVGPVGPVGPSQFFDVWLDRPLSRLTRDECKFVYGEQAFAISKQALTEQQFLRRQRELSEHRGTRMGRK